jgi:hypothetical protein
MRALFADKESVDNVPEFVIVVENKLLSVDVPLTFSLAILAESVTEMRCVFMSPAPIFLAYNESVEIVPELLIVVELTEFNVEFPLTFNFAILAESVTDIRCVLMSPAPNFVAKIESALNTPFILNFLAYNESVEIVPELLIVVLLMVVLLSAATRPLFADNESVVKVPLLVSVVLFMEFMRPLLAKIESALNVVTPLRFGMRALLADSESVVIVPVLLIVVLLIVVLFSTATRPLFADNESVVKVPLLFSDELFMELMRPLFA